MERRTDNASDRDGGIFYDWFPTEEIIAPSYLVLRLINLYSFRYPR
ncbi:MAG: hypothetical protein ACMUIG_04635 [Thermoplasmatota archaeon]